MTSEPALEQEVDRIAPRAIVAVGVGTVAITLALVGVAWLFVARPAPAARPAAHASPLEHGLFDEATGGADARARGLQQLGSAAWIDRHTHRAHIPIDRAIDAVVADPSLLAPRGATP